MSSPVQDVQKVIQLDVSEDAKGETPPRRYTYNELLDLQSRLMLVAGQAEKGKEDVGSFHYGKKYFYCLFGFVYDINAKRVPFRSV